MGKKYQKRVLDTRTEVLVLLGGMPYADPKRNAACRARYSASSERRQVMRKRYHEKRAAGICVMPCCTNKSSFGRVRCDRCQLQGRLNKFTTDPEERAKARQSLETFDGHCDCCGAMTPTDKWRLDHDHATGKFRGIICFHCNVGLGCFFDDIEKMQAAMAYIQKSRGLL